MSDPGGPPVGPPTAGEPAWLPDPSTRHELRWFDGTSFTDQVADGGHQSTDPGGPAPGAGAPAGGASTGTAKKTSKVPLILAGIGVGAVLGGGAYLLFGGHENGFGSFAGTVGDDPGRHDISLSGGSVAVVRLEPSSELDAVVSFEISRDDADRIERLYRDTPFADEAVAAGGEVFRFDVGFDGQPEWAFLALPFGVDATVVVSGSLGTEGDYEIVIDEIALDDVDGDADGDDVLDALVDSDDIPIDLHDKIEQRLTE
jgi:hypothetical protein